MSCTEATPAHDVSSGEDDDESQESEKTRIASPDELVGDSAKAAETKEEKHGEKKKKKRKHAAAAGQGLQGSPGPGRGRPAVLDVQKLQLLCLLPNKMPMPGKRSLNLMKKNCKNWRKK